MTPEVQNHGPGALRTTWLKVLCAFVFTSALVAIPALMPNTNGAFTAKVTNPTNSVTVAPLLTCRQVMASEADGVFAYQFDTDDPLNLVDGKQGTASSKSVSIWGGKTGCKNDTPVSLYFGGISTGLGASFVTYNKSVVPPETYTQELWFRAPPRLINGGSLMALTNSTTYSGENKRNRQLYIDVNGELTAGTSGRELLESKQYVADERWHHVIATRDKDAKVLSLYLDGRPVGSTSAATTLDSFSPAYWRVGCSYLLDISSPRLPNSCFKGDIAFAAVYNRAFTQQDVTRHYKAGTG